MSTITLRAATAADAAPIAEIYLSSRRAFLPYAPLAHPDEDVRRWIAGVLLPSGGVTVAVLASAIAGFLALSDDGTARWIDQLYVAPAFVVQVIGARCLRYAQQVLAPPVGLYTFQANAGARRCYERHGFQAIAFGDGSGNEERCPDVLYQWDGGEGPTAKPA